MATVLAADCTNNGVLVSILSIEGPIEGFEFLKKFNGEESIIIQNESGVLKVMSLESLI